MKKIITVILTIFIFTSSLQALAFSDVDSSDKVMSDSIDTLSQLEILNGYEDGTFRPDAEISRAEMAQIALNLMPRFINAGIAGWSAADSQFFSDVDENYWGLKAIETLSTFGYLNGYEDGTFRPDNPVTYQEAFKIILTMMHYDNVAEVMGGYPDGYARAAEFAQITEDADFYWDSDFNMTDNATRGNIAIIINNALDIPHYVMTNYSIKFGGAYEWMVDENLTFRNMIINSSVGVANTKDQTAESVE